MTGREAFKFGFLLRCADEGLSSEQTRHRIDTVLEKRAFGKGLFDLVQFLASYPVTVGGTAVAGSALGGAGLGYLGAKATEQDVDPEEAKSQELVAVYQQQADRARRNAARFRYRQPRMKRPQFSVL